MREISDAFLLNMAEVSASLVGLFIVGVFVYVEVGINRGGPLRSVEAPYIRSSAQIVILVYAIAIGLSITLVALDLIWSRLLLVVFSVLLVAANVDTVRRVSRLARRTSSPILITTEVVGTVATILAITLPWILGGLEPNREDLTWTILLAFASGFIGIWAMVLTAFDIGARDAAALAPDSAPVDAGLEPPEPAADRAVEPEAGVEEDVVAADGGAEREDPPHP